MIFCLSSMCSLAKREKRLKQEEDALKRVTASVAFQNDDKFQKVQ